jgi:hypothetical protein
MSARPRFLGKARAYWALRGRLTGMPLYNAFRASAKNG